MYPICPGRIWRHTCCYIGVRVASKSISSGAAIQQPANSKPSAVPFFTLLMASSSTAASLSTEGLSGTLASQPQADKDTDSADHTDSSKKRDQKSPVGVPVDNSAIAGDRLLDASISLQLPHDFSAANPGVQKSELIQNTTTASGASVDESFSCRSANPAQTAQINQCDSVQQRALATAIFPQPASDRASKAASGSDVEGVHSVDSTTDKARSDAHADATSIQDGGTGSTLQGPDLRIASQMSLALESSLMDSQALPNNPNLGPSPLKLAQGKNTGGVNSANTDAATTRIQAKSSAVDPVSAPASGSQSAQVPTQHSQIDIAQSSASTTKTLDGSVLPTDFASPRPPAHDTPSPASTSTDAGAGLHRGEDFGADPQSHLDSATTAGSSGINAVRVMQTMSESEMRVGMRSVEFGDISIRTSVSQQQLVTQITVDHRDLGNAISSHISAAQAKLGNDYGIHASIEVKQSGTSFSGDRQNPQQQAQRQSARSLQFPNGSVEAESNRTTPMPVSALNDAYRLDIRA